MPLQLHLWIDRKFRIWGNLYLLLVLLFCCAAMYTLRVSFWRGPWRDMWEAMPFIEKALAGHASWFDYWSQYGFSHRPFISRLLWVADFRWFAASNGLLLAVSLLLQGVTFLAVRAVLQRDVTFSADQRRIVLIGVIFCLLNITQVFNLLYTYDVQWFLVVGFVVLSLERILANEHYKSPIGLLVSWLCVLLASLNNFSALVMWPIEMFLLLLLRFPVYQIIGFFVATLFYLLFYFYQLLPEEHSIVGGFSQYSSLQMMQALVWILIVYPCWYLANPLSFQLANEGPLHAPWPLSWFAPAVAGVLIFLTLWHWGQGLLRKKNYSAVVWFGLSLMLYGYGVGVATAFGRGNFWENVYELRYQNIVLLFWVGVIIWLAASVRVRNAGLVVGACLLFLVFGFRAAWYHELILKTGNRTRDAHLALVVGLENQLSAIQSTVQRFNLGPDSTYNLRQEAQFLRTIHAGPYADPAWQVPLSDLLQSAETCRSVASDFDVHGDDASYARLTISFQKPVNYTLIVWFDSDNADPGLLIATRADDFFGRLQQSYDGFSDYAGFAKNMPKKKPENIFAGNGDKWCRLEFSPAAGQ